MTQTTLRRFIHTHLRRTDAMADLRRDALDAFYRHLHMLVEEHCAIDLFDNRLPLTLRDLARFDRARAAEFFAVELDEFLTGLEAMFHITDNDLRAIAASLADDLRSDPAHWDEIVDDLRACASLPEDERPCGCVPVPEFLEHPDSAIFEIIESSGLVRAVRDDLRAHLESEATLEGALEFVP